MAKSVPKIAVSDHYPVGVVYGKHMPKSAFSKHKTVKFRNIKHFEKDSFLLDLQSKPWHLILSEDDPNNAANLFSELFSETLDNHAPRTEKSQNTKAPTVAT